MAEFKSVSIDSAKDFLTKHHWGVLATRRKNGSLQMSPITPGLDAEGRVIISSRETAYKVNNLRRDPRAALCVFTRPPFTAKVGFKSMAARKSFLFRTL